MRLSCAAKIAVSAETGDDDQETITMRSRQEQPVLYTEALTSYGLGRMWDQLPLVKRYGLLK